MVDDDYPATVPLKLYTLKELQELRLRQRPIEPRASFEIFVEKRRAKILRLQLRVKFREMTVSPVHDEQSEHIKSIYINFPTRILQDVENFFLQTQKLQPYLKWQQPRSSRMY